MQDRTFFSGKQKLLGAYLSPLSFFYDSAIELSSQKDPSSRIVNFIENRRKAYISDVSEISSRIQRDSCDMVLCDGTFNHCLDIQNLLVTLKKSLNRQTRIYAIMYNPYLKWLYQIATICKLRKGPMPVTFLTKRALKNLCDLTGFEIVYKRSIVFFPFLPFKLGLFVNNLFSLLPFVNELAITQVVVLRPIIQCDHKPSLSIVIPARNEQGNIARALSDLSEWDRSDLEVIFVEGHSTDDTWGEIQRQKEEFKDRVNIKVFKQNGRGKNDAVRLGFSHAAGELLTILDADLTVPPFMLERFYEAYFKGQADFVNGTRLLYPMEKNAMRFLNLIGNIFFANILSFLLSANIYDSLCGTKMLSRRDYERFCLWRKKFGDFDPFGDFELLFPAAILGLGIINIPIRYLERTYGETNIQRFRHGLLLLKMTMIGLFKIRFGFKNH